MRVRRVPRAGHARMAELCALAADAAALGSASELPQRAVRRARGAELGGDRGAHTSYICADFMFSNRPV